ncbi:MAG: (Fe-S)-binding protein [Acidobacteriota bacterium]
MSTPEKLSSHADRTDLTPECVHCGLCLQACPTYLELGKEADSPRGRLYLMRSLERGKTAFSNSFVQHISACLDCRACESACPSGVPYGELVERAREVIESRIKRSWWVTQLRDVVFEKIFPSPVRLRRMFNLLRWYQKSGLQRLVRALGMLKLLGGHFAEIEQMLPDIRRKDQRVLLGTVFPAVGEKKHRVALLTGCVMNEIFGDINLATIRVLQRNGCEIVIPADQVCCAALHCHAGVTATAREMARQNIAAFERAQVDAVIVNASGCGAKLKEYGQLLADDAAFRERARQFSATVRDIAEFLVNLEVRPSHSIACRATYDDPCHLLHAQRVAQAPRQLLTRIPGLQLVELEHPDQCCGSAGIYNITNHDLSMRILDRKIEDIRNTQPDIVVTGNPGCMLQIAYGLRRAGLERIRVVHPVELLDQAYGPPEQ